jgi:hypothetical protein
MRQLHAYYLVSRVVVDITKANELATPVELCVDFVRPFSFILYPLSYDVRRDAILVTIRTRFA